jgi:hypothetical protein
MWTACPAIISAPAIASAYQGGAASAMAAITSARRRLVLSFVNLSIRHPDER